jgi:hypothetical protein
MSKFHKCKVCKDLFTKTRPLQVVCSPQCGLTLASEKIAKSKALVAKAEKKVIKAKLEGMKTRSQWIKECQVQVNKYVRLRDIKRGLGCVSCGAPYREGYGGAFDAGHLRSVGSAPHLRFLTTQISLQCAKCNRWGGGRAFEFRAEMVRRNGQEWMDRLEGMNGRVDFTINYLKRLKAIMQKKIKRLKYDA